MQEHNWLHFIKTETNSPQAYKRLYKHSIEAIDDLGLLASRLPNDKQFEIFNEETIGNLLKSILLIDKSEDKAKVRNSNLQLASMLIDVCIYPCLVEFRKQNKNTPESSKPTIEYLERAVLICKEIGRQHQRNYIEKEAVKMKERVICIWEGRFSFDYLQFEKYIYQEMKVDAPDLNIESIDTGKKYEFHYVIRTFIDGLDEYYFLGEIKIVFSTDKKEGGLLDNNSGRMVFYDQQGNEIKNKQVKIKKFGAQRVLFEVK